MVVNSHLQQCMHAIPLREKSTEIKTNLLHITCSSSSLILLLSISIVLGSLPLMTLYLECPTSHHRLDLSIPVNHLRGGRRVTHNLAQNKQTNSTSNNKLELVCRMHTTPKNNKHRIYFTLQGIINSPAIWVGGLHMLRGKSVDI